MAVPNTPVYERLLREIDRSEQAFMTCEIPHTKPRLSRLMMWDLANIGDQLYSDQLFADALDYYKQAKKIDGDEPSILNQIGACLVEFQRIPGALYNFQLMERRVTVTLENPEECSNSRIRSLYNIPSRSLHAIRNDAAANKVYALYNSAHCHEVMGNINEAIVTLRKSLKLSSYPGAEKLLEAWHVSEKIALLRECIAKKAFHGFMTQTGVIRQTLFGTSAKTKISTERIENTNKFEI